MICNTHLCDITYFTHFKITLMKTFTPITKEDIQVTVYSYEPPAIELIEVTVEKGFADSIIDWTPTAW